MYVKFLSFWTLFQYVFFLLYLKGLSNEMDLDFDDMHG